MSRGWAECFYFSSHETGQRGKKTVSTMPQSGAEPWAPRCVGISADHIRGAWPGGPPWLFTHPGIVLKPLLASLGCFWPLSVLKRTCGVEKGKDNWLKNTKKKKYNWTSLGCTLLLKQAKGLFSVRKCLLGFIIIRTGNNPGWELSLHLRTGYVNGVVYRRSGIPLGTGKEWTAATCDTINLGASCRM